MTVTHVTGAPFIVRTGTVEARVLGTTFDVRHYPEDPAVRVAVVTGRIAERNWRGTIHLAAGDVSLMTDSSATVITDPDVQSSVAWTQGQLTFTDTPVPAMLATLGRWYGYQFELEDSTLTTHYVTASFDVTKPDEAMVVLRKMLGVTVRIDGSHVTLQPQLRTQRGPVPTRRGTAELLPPSTEVGR
jgi:ferric-dicitrate binding protein FerR (iron transport regulator)